MDNQQLQTGQLIVKAKSGTVDFPVSGVMITLTSELGENSTVESVLYTDESGIAGPVFLPASTLPTPGEEKKNLLRYTVEADKEGYYSLIRYGVNIFPNTTTIQNLLMIPLPVDLGKGYNANGITYYPDADENGNNTIYIRPERKAES